MNGTFQLELPDDRATNRSTNMQHNTSIMTAAIIAATGSIASADIVRVDEFSSHNVESFENLTIETFDRGDVNAFDNMATMYNLSGTGYLHTTGSWSFKQRVGAYDGDKLLGSNTGIGYRFNEAQMSFGGFFASITEDADGAIRFYNGDQLIATDTVLASTDQSWAWNGWSSNVSFDRVEIESNYMSMGYLLHDAVRVLSTQTPAPGGAALAFGGLLVIARRRR